jgi:hypothetical protein
VGLMVGPLPLKQLIDQFIHYNFSVGGFISNLKAGASLYYVLDRPVSEVDGPRY